MPAPDPEGVTVQDEDDGLWSVATYKTYSGGMVNRRRRAKRILMNMNRDGWSCPICGGPVHHTKRADAIYCSPACKAVVRNRKRRVDQL